jgi:hypothetical protein
MAKQDEFEGAESVLIHLRNFPPDHPHVRHELDEIRTHIEERNVNRRQRRA